jgi:iron(III) transport system ATP-binding protein
MSAITLDGVSRSFGSNTAVDGISLSVEPGEFVTLLGPSGCGKTTTLRMVAGLERNTGGRISIHGEVVSDPARKLFVTPERRRLGMVFQSYAIWPHMTVFENVAYPLRIRRRPPAEVERRVKEALRLVEMEPYADRPAPALSGGQQQRVAIARALVFEPQVLLLDEPLSNLDARLRMQMGDDLRALQKRLGITSLYVTHDQTEAMSLSDRVVVMSAGHILQVAPPRDIYLRPASKSVASFFGAPNLLPGSVSSCQSIADGEYLLQVSGPGWQGRCRAGFAAQHGEPVLVMVRPESMRLSSADELGHSDDIVLSGHVVDTIFRGTCSSVVFQGDAGRVNAEVSALAPVAAGGRVTFAVEPGAAWAMKP